MRLSIIVPALNEERALSAHLGAALALGDEVIVSDGGSRDATCAVARKLGARVVEGPPGRGGQLNRGAAAASGDILLFLHADTRLDARAGTAIREAIARGAEGGAFLVRFDVDRPALRLGARLMNARTRLTRLPLGDQAQFVRREVFAELEGFREWPILEDLDFALRLRRRGHLTLLAGPATTAARRFLERGIPRTIATNWLIWMLYAVGVSPARLAKLYGHVR